MEKYARRCDITGCGMNDGYVFGDGDTLYISTKELLIEFLKTLDWEDCNGNLSKDIDDDEELLDYFYQEDAYCYTEWYESDMEDEWYDEDGNKFNN
jgi:hypothetical protein